MNSGGETIPLVGRTGPIARISQVFERGQGLLVLRGEAGIGKSRVLEEATLRASDAGWRIAAASCYETEPAISLLPLLGLLRQLDAGDELERLVEFSGGAGYSSPGTSDPRLRLFLAVDRLLRAATERAPLCLVVEDLHWADNDTLLLLNYLADQKIPRLVVLLSQRTGPSSQLLSRLAGKAEAISLGALYEGECREFILNACGLITDAEVGFLHEFTGGNPLFLSEIAFCLNESDQLERRTVMELVESRSLPDSVSDLIEFRLSALPASTQHVLLAASCTGATFCQEMLVDGLKLPASEVEDALKAGLRADFLRLSEDRTRDMRFSHPMTQEALLRRLDAQQGRRYHGDLGRLAIARPGLFTIEQTALHQAKGFRGEELDLARETCVQAAANAEKSLAFEAAAGFWRLALACVAQGERSLERAGLLRKLAEAERAGAAWDSALDSLESAFALLEELGEQADAARVAYEVGELLRYQLNVSEAANWFIVALDRFVGETDKAACRAMLGSCYISMGRAEQGLELVIEAWQVAEVQGTVSPAVARWTAQAVSGAGQPLLAKQILTTGLDRALAMHDSSQAIQLAGSLVFSALHELDIDGAKQQVGIIESIPGPFDAAALTRMMLCRCLVAAYEGNWRQTRDVARSWGSEVRRAGRFHKATADLLFAEASSVLGRHANALSVIQRCRSNLQEMSSVAMLYEARFHLRAGDFETARTLVLEAAAQTMADASPGRHLFLADLVGSLGLEQLAAELYAELSQETRGMVIVYTPTSVGRVLGKLAAAQGDWLVAIDHFERAVDSLGKAGARYEQAQALLDYAEARATRRRRGDRERAQALRVQALGLFDALDLPRPMTQLFRAGDPYGLSTREREVLLLIARGSNNAEVARTLGISPHTVERHLENVFAKMNVGSRAQAVAQATSAGLIA